MKKRILFSLIVVGVLFILAGCDKTNTSDMVGKYHLIGSVRDGVTFDEEQVKSENVTFEVKEDNTAILDWGGLATTNYRIEDNKFIAIDMEETLTFTYSNGILKILDAVGDSFTFKK